MSKELLKSLALVLGIAGGAVADQREKFNTTVTDVVDRAEVNSFYDEHGRKIFDQIIWYNWNTRDSCWEVVDWRLMKAHTREEKGLPKRHQAPGREFEGMVPLDIPCGIDDKKRQVLEEVNRHRRAAMDAFVDEEDSLMDKNRMWPIEQADGTFESNWKDGEVMRKVIAKTRQRTRTQFDPELVARDHLPKDKREKLRNPRSKLFSTTPKR